MSPRNSPRVDRRRRVLVDESRHEDAPTRPRIFRGDDEGPLSRYNEAALHAINAPIAKYIPLRPLSLAIWFLVGLMPILGLMLLDQRRFQLAEFMGSDALRIFNFGAPGSLSNWCASLVFAVAVPVILGIYSVRRHRRDDYRGRFAVWQWVIFVALLASVDCAVGLHRLLQGTCEHVLKAEAWGNGSGWWVLAWALLVGSTMLRLVFEMSESRKSVGWMLSGVVCYLWCTLVETNVGGLDQSTLAHSSQIPLLLLGHHFVLFGLVNYARDVVREAMGTTEAPAKPTSKVKQVVPSTEQKATPATKLSKPAKPAEAPKLHAASAAAKPTTQKQSKPLAQQVMKVVGQDDGSDSEMDVDSPKLTKAERRRLRKEQKQRRKAA